MPEDHKDKSLFNEILGMNSHKILRTKIDVNDWEAIDPQYLKLNKLLAEGWEITHVNDVIAKYDVDDIHVKSIYHLQKKEEKD